MEKTRKFLNKNLPQPDDRIGSGALLDPYKRLMAAILIQSLIDIERGDYIERVDAITWLATSEADQIGELVGIEHPFKAYVTGHTKLPDYATRGRKEIFGWRVAERKFSKTLGYR